jgi:acetyltransferase (GNAT) family protein
MPQNLGTGYEAMPVMKSYCWVAEHEGRIVGMLMAAPCHGVLYIARICVPEGAPKLTAAMLFRHVMADAKKMGFLGYFTHIDPSRETERAMIPICRKAKGIQVPMMQVPLVGSVEEAARF